MSKKTAFILFIVFILSRLLFLTRLPIFNDESMYLHWGLLFRDDPSKWTASLTIDGKQPGMPVLLGTVLRIPGDPLFLGRLVSLAFALLTFVMTLKIARRLDMKIPIPLVSSFLIVSPYLLQYDRLALMESAVTSSAVVAAYVLLRWLGQPKLVFAVLFGAAAALGWWFKSTSLIILISGLTVSVFAGSVRRLQVRTILTFLLIVIGTYFMMTLPVRSSAGYVNIGLRERERVMSFTELLGFPLNIWRKNAVFATAFLTAFMTPVMLVLAAGSFGKLKKNPAMLVISGFFVIPFITEILVSKAFTSRYLVMIVPFGCLLAAATVSALNKKMKAAVFGLAVLTAIIPSALLIAVPLRYYAFLAVVPPAQEDFGQYVRSYSSGYGVKEAVMSVPRLSEGEETIILVRADSGNPEDAVFVYADRLPNLYVGYDQSYLRQIAREGFIPRMDTFFISRGPQFGYLKPYLEPAGKYTKPFGEDYVGVYRVRIE